MLGRPYNVQVSETWLQIILQFRYKGSFWISTLGQIAPTKIKLIRELTILLVSNPLHVLMQKLLKSMKIN